MKYLPFLFVILLFAACETTETAVKKSPSEQPAEISTGWAGNDVYTVKASGENEKEAVENAKHRILRDIVNVRVMSSSPFTDITKIKQEFKEPFEKGEVLSRQQKGSDLEIYYQIREKGLKDKFHRK